jgi:hypothetical protein
MCVQGECQKSPLILESNCPFGDDVIVNDHLIVYANLPQTQMNCEEVLNFVSISLNQFPVSYCANPRFKAACCSTCQSKSYQNELEGLDFNHFFK